tara:strand:- start:530 stop:1399 length:870 start_codon:yes stop_codon:yes gene_type:complete
MADMTATTLATYLAEVWSQLVTITYRSNVVLPNLMDRRWEPEISVGRGDTVNIPNFTRRSGANKRSTFGTGASLTFTATTESQTQLQIDQMAYEAFRMPVEMSVQKMGVYEPLLTEDIARGIILQVDSELASHNSNGIDAFTAVGTDNEDVTNDLILDTETVLNDNNAPIENRYFVVSPATRASLMKIEIFRNSLYQGAIGNIPGDKGPGFLGQVYTLDVYQSNNLEAGTAGKKNGMFQKEAIAMAMQKGVTVHSGINIADGLFQEVAGFAVYGHKLVQSNYGREVAGK